MSQPKKLRILIVDDNPSDRMVVKAVVGTLWPLLVHEAENVQIAEGKLKTAVEIDQPYDLVMLDWNMPGANGLKLLQSVRMKTIFRSTIIIVMTATSAKDVVMDAIKNGADDFIVKPIHPNLLQQKIGKLTAPVAAAPPTAKKSS